MRWLWGCKTSGVPAGAAGGAIDEGAALDDRGLAPIQEASTPSNSETGSSRSLPSHQEDTNQDSGLPEREGSLCRGCFGREKPEPPAVDAHDRPLRRDRREIPDDLASLPIREAKERLLEALREEDEPRSAGVVQRASPGERLADLPPVILWKHVSVLCPCLEVLDCPACVLQCCD